MPLRAVVQVVGDTGKEAAQAREESVHITALQLADELADIERGVCLGYRSVEGTDEVEETIFHLLVGEPQRVHPEALVVVLNRQISALINHGYRIVYIRAVIAQRSLIHLNTLHLPQVEIGLLQHLHQEGGRAAGKPVITIRTLLQGTQHTEGIVHGGEFLVFGEPVSVILASQPIHHLPAGRITFHCQSFQFRREGSFYLRTGHAAKGVIVEVETDIVQLVQITENTHLRELGHSGDEDELQPGVGIFEHSIESGQRLPEVVLQLLTVERTQQGFVIFVNKHHHAAPRLFAGAPDDGHETSGVRNTFPSRPV